MKINEMTTAELDKALAELMGVTVTDKHKEGNFIYIPFPPNPSRPKPLLWNPTNINSNQLQRYVFPKLLDQGLKIYIKYYPAAIHIEVWSKDYEGFGWTKIVDMYHSLLKDQDKINETIAKACLKAWEGMK